MGQRYSDAFNIRKSDIGKSVILKHSKYLAQWWIWRQRNSRFVDLVGKKMKTNDNYLYCIIACDDADDGIRQENEEFIAIEGIKFTNDDKGNDLDDFKRKVS